VISTVLSASVRITPEKMNLYDMMVEDNLPYSRVLPDKKPGCIYDIPVKKSSGKGRREMIRGQGEVIAASETILRVARSTPRDV